MSPECQTPVLGGACYPPHLWEASVPLLYQGGAPSAPTCCSLLCFPCRSEFTDTILSVHPSDVLDMPVDPNEPTYCLCHQVSYGEMIGCDNPDCPIEWFHFACVDLTTKPKGKWFCPRCVQERRKKK
ncbi:inhibitor of growth protein 5-like isoform X2 [Eumetopias jubatus]|uniref:inhibitor of growth protein 5-like isoform X2 n=1 Tax=Eumetopias jubatus TaxID=34886 RepID=UPI001016B4E9|nr:inhibitor of growth protein 5-like isoform X2 [Eumetopias jubatus]